MRIIIIFACLALVFGCSQAPEKQLTYTVEKRSFDIEIPAFGELEAANSYMITSPPSSSMTIEWLAPEFSYVKKGDLIVKFDPQQLSIKAQKEMFALEALNADLNLKEVENEVASFELETEQQVIDYEMDFVDTFQVDDLRVYSQLEIIDSMQNKEYLKEKSSFLDWKQDSIEEQSSGKLAVLNITKKGHMTKLERHQKSLQELEIRAPFDGLLIYAQNWRGEKPIVGQTMFPGANIAKLPDLRKIQVKLYVLDKEAINLAVEQQVSLRLDAFPDAAFTGKVIDVAAFSRSINRGDPTKYFELKVEITDGQESLLEPGRKATASIQVQAPSERLVVPIQSLINKDGQSFVAVRSAGDYQLVPVTLGEKNLHFVEVLDGLQAGQDVALSLPEGMAI